MRKFLIFVSIVAIIVVWVVNFVTSGKFENYLDKRKNTESSAKIEYTWANLAAFTGKKNLALAKYRKILDKYPETAVAPYAWFELIELLDDSGLKKECLEECNKFLEKNPNHPKAVIIKSKVRLILYGY